MTISNEQLVPVERNLSAYFKWAAPGNDQEDTWLIRFCESDIGDMIFTGDDAEQKAWEAWNRHSPGYNCYVFRLAALLTPPARHPGWTERGKQWLADGAPIEQLKPCPFCGSAAKLYPNDDPDAAAFVMCTDDDAGSCSGCYVEKNTTAGAIAAWNTRTPPAVEPDEGLVEKAQMIIAQGIYGPKFDPFLAPETWDWCEPIAQTLVANLTPSIRAQALEEAAKVAETLVGDRNGVPERIRIAAAIRALKGGQGV